MVIGSKNASSKLIDARIKELDDWRGEVLARVRAANPGLRRNFAMANELRSR
jgi:hypothetical protein